MPECGVVLAEVSCTVLKAQAATEGTATPSSEAQQRWIHCHEDAGNGEDAEEGSVSQAALVQVALREEQFHLHSCLLQGFIVHHLH